MTVATCSAPKNQSSPIIHNIARQWIKSLFKSEGGAAGAQCFWKWQAFMVTPKTTPFPRRAHKTDRTYLHLLVNFPFHGVRWFSASFIFWGSTFFLHLCHFLQYLSIFTLGEKIGACLRRGRFRVAQRRVSGARRAPVKLMLLLRARDARLSQPSSA